MRYKFRAWLKDEKKMVVPYGINFEKKVIFYKELYEDDENMETIKTASFDEIELMHYTGLKDKNGVEIYEGDIVKYERNNFTYSLKIGVAEFNDTDLGSCGCCFDEFFGAGFVIKTVKTKNDDGKYFSIYDLEKSETIGNIYENKEVLEDE